MRSPNWRVMGSPAVLGVFLLVAGCGGDVEEKKSYPVIADVWDYSEKVDSRTVDTHIRRIRRKLGPEADRIETVIGVGYRMRC